VRAALEVLHAGRDAARAHRPSAGAFRLVAAAAFIAMTIALAVVLVPGREVPAESPEFAAPAAAPIAVAVLPFGNPGDGPELEYLTEGIAEAVISTLAQVPDKLRVISKSAVQRCRGRPVDAQPIGRDLSVAAVLPGWVVQRRDVVTIYAELVSTKDQSLIWRDQYETTLRELIEVQHTIATRMSGALQLRLSADEQRALRRQYPTNTDAYEPYLRGQHHWSLSTPDDYRRSLNYFQEAIQRDSTYALAHAGLARVLSTMT
jgi:TolB-like protein